MNGFELLNAIGMIDDSFIVHAEKNIKTYRNFTMIRRTIVTIAASCALLAVVIGLGLMQKKPTDIIIDEMPPMVYVNSQLYVSSGKYITQKDEKLEYIGQIKSHVDSSEHPTEEFQANDDIVGADVFQYGNDIVVLINDKYYVYIPQ